MLSLSSYARLRAYAHLRAYARFLFLPSLVSYHARGGLQKIILRSDIMINRPPLSQKD